MDFVFGKNSSDKSAQPLADLEALDPRNQAALAQSAELAPALKSNGGNAVNTDATRIAEAGTQTGGSEIPYRAEMESSFGTDFSNVQAHFGDAAQQSSQALGAKAYAMGNQVAFADPNPSKSLVAHELTHVVQQANGPQMKATEGAVDTSGEAQAEAVEAAVARGESARSVLGDDVQACAVAPALKEDPKTMGICQSISHSGLTIDRSVPIWEGDALMGMLGPVFFYASAGVSGTIGTAINWAQPGAQATGVIEGFAGFKANLGPDIKVAQLYGEAMGEAKGGLMVTVEKANGFSVGLNAEFSGRLSAGISLLGVLDKRYDPVSMTIGTFKGIEWNSQKGLQAGVWEWGPEIQNFIDWVKEQIEFAENVVKLAGSMARAVVVLQAIRTKGEDAIRNPWNYLDDVLRTLPEVSPIQDHDGNGWDWLSLPWQGFSLPEVEINYGKVLELGAKYLTNRFM